MKNKIFNSKFNAITLSLFFLFFANYCFAQTTIHYWNFNTGSSTTADDAWPVASPIIATLGSGILTHNFTTTEDFAGTLINVEGTDPAGKAFCPRSVTAGANNGNSFNLAIPTTGFSNIVVSYAAQRNTSAFTTHTVDYSLDGSTFVTGFQTITGLPPTTLPYAIQTIDFSAVAGAANNSAFTVRITLTGSTGVSQSNRIDNLKVTGSCVTPSEPTIQASALVTSNLQCSEVQLNWTNGDGSNRIVVVKAGTAVASVPVDQNVYVANNTFGAGGIIAAGEYIVYNGTGNTVTIKGLSNATTYHFSVFEYNQGSTCPNFYTSAVIPAGSVTTLTCSLEIQSILVDACVSGGGCINAGSLPCSCEGKNEMVRFLNGPSPINTSDIFISWPSNSYLGISPQNATTNANTLFLNSTVISPCGLLKEPPGNIIPAGAIVLLVTSTDICLGANSFANLADTLYIIYQNAGNFAGHFGNFDNNPLNAPFDRSLAIWQSPSMEGDTIIYFKNLLTKPNGSVGAADGAAVNYTSSGVASYINIGCQAPFASLLANAGIDLAICTGTSVSLVGASSKPYSTILWQGGSGTFSSPTTLTTNYTPSVSESGTVLLSLRLIGFCNDTAYDTLVLSVTITPGPTVTSPVTYCQGASATALSATGSGLLWYTSSSGGVGVNPLIPSTATAGTTSYFVSQTINGCEGPRTQIDLTVNANPAASILSNSASTCAGITLALVGSPSGGSGTFVSNVWTGTGAGSLSATNIVNPDFTNTTAGSYTLTYTVTDNLGCSATSGLTVSVNANPVSSITPNPASTCAGISLALNANPGGGSGIYSSQLWTGAGATSLSGNNIANPDFTNVLAGSYALTYTITDDNGCIGTTNTTITINANPTASITPGPATTCAGIALPLNGNPAGGSGTYTINAWSGVGASGLSDSNIVNPDFSNAVAGVYPLAYTITDNNGCIGTAGSSVTVNDNPTTSITPDPVVTCAGVAVTLNGNPTGGSGIYSANVWSGAGASGLSTTTIVNPDFSNATSGSFSLNFTVTDNFGCVGTSNTTVTVNANPTASITPSPAETCAGITLSLNGNPVGGSGTYSTNTWSDIGSDSLTSTNIVNPDFTNSMAGSYSLTYTIIDDLGCIGTANTTVTVNTNPTVSITPSPAEICEGVNLSLNGNPIGGSGIFPTHLWSGAGATSLIAGTGTSGPTFNNATAGTYLLSYSVTDSKGCSGTETSSVSVDPNPVIISVPFTNESVCGAGDGSITINATGLGLTYSINGGTSFVAGNVFSPLVAGSYSIFVKNSLGCTVNGGSISIASPGAPSPPIASANLNPICSGQSLTLSVFTPVMGETYTWTGPGLAATQGTPITLANTTTAMSGNYAVTASAGGCISPAGNISIVVNPNPTASITPAPAVTCAGVSLTLNGNPVGGSGIYPTNTWSNAGVTSLSASNLVNPDFTNSATGSYPLTYTVTDNQGCIGTANTLVTVNANPIADAGAIANTTCSNPTLTLDGSGSSPGANYNWVTSNGNIVSGAGTINPLIDQAGTYTITVTDAAGCFSSDAVTIGSNTIPPVADAGIDQTINCGQNSLILDGSLSSIGSGVIYGWSTNNGNIIANGSSPTPSVNQAGLYTLTVTTINNGCSASSNVTILAGPVPAASFTTSPNPPEGTLPLIIDFTNSSQNATTYFWFFGDSNSSTVASPSNTYNTSGTYYAMLIASDNSLCPDTATITITVYDEFSLVIPNVFTPNGDLNNDFFIIKGTGIKEFSMNIFDRWGLKMFETNNITIGWNGRTESENPASEGTYFYIINFIGNDNKPKEKKGALTLIR